MRFNKKGTILITSLWILTILAILAAGIGFRASIEARLSKYNMDRLKGLYLAKAGIFKSQELLSRSVNHNDSIRECGIVLNPGMSSSYGEDILAGIFTGNLGDGKFVVSYDEEGKNYYGMMDEERRININKASKDVLQRLFVNEEVAASVITWRGTAQVLNGAWDSDYKSLAAPYECKHADFSCVEELMLVKGMTPELFESVKDYVTIYGDGKVNINTAPRRVMLALGLSVPAIDAIIMLRNGPDNIAGTKDDVPFAGIGSIANQIGLTPDSPDRTVLAENNFTTASNYFRIEAKGAVDRSRVTSKIMCVADKGAKKLVSYREY